MSNSRAFPKLKHLSVILLIATFIVVKENTAFLTSLQAAACVWIVQRPSVFGAGWTGRCLSDHPKCHT